MAEQWPEFKSQFLELTQGEGLTPAVTAAQLRKNLLKEAISLITEMREMEDIWLALDRQYGDTNLAIITTRAKRVNLDTSGRKLYQNFFIENKGIRRMFLGAIDKICSLG